MLVKYPTSHPYYERVKQRPLALAVVSVAQCLGIDAEDLAGIEATSDVVLNEHDTPLFEIGKVTFGTLALNLLIYHEANPFNAYAPVEFLLECEAEWSVLVHIHTPKKVQCDVVSFFKVADLKPFRDAHGNVVALIKNLDDSACACYSVSRFCSEIL